MLANMIVRTILAVFGLVFAFLASLVFLPENTYWKLVYSLIQVDVLGSENTEVLSNKIAYSFTREIFTVTVDSGRTWKTWNLPNFEQQTGDKCGFFIVDVNIDSRGTGVLRSQDGCEGSGASYKTQDFGIFWKDSRL
jgi:hypothetical protein